jgi:hypothetical protein
MGIRVPEGTKSSEGYATVADGALGGIPIIVEPDRLIFARFGQLSERVVIRRNSGGSQEELRRNCGVMVRVMLVCVEIICAA